jgi:hypothetical protein
MPAVKYRAVAVAVAVSRRPVTEDRVRSHAIPREFYGGQMAVGQVFLWVVCFPSVSINAHTLLYLHVALTRTNGRSLRTFQKARAIQKIKAHMIETYVSFCSF